MKIPRISGPVLRRGSRTYRDAGRKQSVNISQDLSAGMPNGGSDSSVLAGLEEGIEIPLELTDEGDLHLFAMGAAGGASQP